MGKVRDKVRKKLDVNGDGKVNFKDFIAILKKSVDTDDDGKIQAEELGTAVTNILGVIENVKG